MSDDVKEEDQVLVSFRCYTYRCSMCRNRRPVLVSFRCYLRLFFLQLIFNKVLVSFRCYLFQHEEREYESLRFSFFSLLPHKDVHVDPFTLFRFSFFSLLRCR